MDRKGIDEILFDFTMWVAMIVLFLILFGVIN